MDLHSSPLPASIHSHTLFPLSLLNTFRTSSLRFSRSSSSSDLLSAHPLQDLGIPPLSHIRMAPDPILQRRFAQMPPPPLHKRKLNIIPPHPAPLRHLRVPHRQYLGGYIHALERAVVAYAWELWHAVPGAGAGGRVENSMGCGFAHAVS